jgi:hypothetical protein
MLVVNFVAVLIISLKTISIMLFVFLRSYKFHSMGVTFFQDCIVSLVPISASFNRVIASNAVGYVLQQLASARRQVSLSPQRFREVSSRAIPLASLWLVSIEHLGTDSLKLFLTWPRNDKDRILSPSLAHQHYTPCMGICHNYRAVTDDLVNA